MKILIDCRSLQTYSAFRGIGRYTRQLIDIFRNDRLFHFLFFNAKHYRPELERKIFLNSPRRLITFTDHVLLKKLLVEKAIRVYHSPAFALPKKPKNTFCLLTVHDLTPLLFPNFSSARHRYIFRKIIKSSRSADVVMTVSRHTADDLLNYLPQLEGRIRVIHNALDKNINPAFAQKPDIDLPSEYLFYTGGNDKIKNLKTVVQSIRFHKLPLVIAGKIEDSSKRELLTFLNECYHHLVYFCGYVSDNELSYLYRNAKVFAFPSLYEGFGYPPLEALRCGTLSVVSRRSSIPEVMGESALYVDDPLDPEAFALKVNELIEDTELEKRLLKSGKRILETYTLEKFREKLQAIYEEILKEK